MKKKRRVLESSRATCPQIQGDGDHPRDGRLAMRTHRLPGSFHLNRSSIYRPHLLDRLLEIFLGMNLV
jgi:hypothetical protein